MRPRFNPWLGSFPGKGMANHSSNLAWRIPQTGYSPWDHKESDTTERLHFHFSLSCIREGNGNPLQYSCLENTRDGGAWWAAVSGVTQTLRLKRLSSSSSLNIYICDRAILVRIKRY